jgi:hypothetical protein
MDHGLLFPAWPLPRDDAASAIHVDTIAHAVAVGTYDGAIAGDASSVRADAWLRQDRGRGWERSDQQHCQSFDYCRSRVLHVVVPYTETRTTSGPRSLKASNVFCRDRPPATKFELSAIGELTSKVVGMELSGLTLLLTITMFRTLRFY